MRNGIVLYEVKLKVKGEHQNVKLNDKGEIVQKDDDRRFAHSRRQSTRRRTSVRP